MVSGFTPVTFASTAYDGTGAVVDFKDAAGKVRETEYVFISVPSGTALVSLTGNPNDAFATVPAGAWLLPVKTKSIYVKSGTASVIGFVR